jgi:hypothetical protein
MTTGLLVPVFGSIVSVPIVISMARIIAITIVTSTMATIVAVPAMPTIAAITTITTVCELAVLAGLGKKTIHLLNAYKILIKINRSRRGCQG